VDVEKLGFHQWWRTELLTCSETQVSASRPKPGVLVRRKSCRLLEGRGSAEQRTFTLGSNVPCEEAWVSTLLRNERQPFRTREAGEHTRHSCRRWRRSGLLHPAACGYPNGGNQNPHRQFPDEISVCRWRRHGLLQSVERSGQPERSRVRFPPPVVSMGVAKTRVAGSPACTLNSSNNFVHEGLRLGAG
jgi:hypothetical protein